MSSENQNDKPKATEIDEFTGMETTGHDWDGIKELANPAPRWWLWTWLVSIIWSIGYWIIMPAWPLISDYTHGSDNYSSRGAVIEELAAAEEAQSGLRDQLLAASYAEVRDNGVLFDFAYGGGKSAFGLHCAQCHGLGASGAPGIANLNDDDWIWGGNIEAIEATITYGIRAEPMETRFSEMPSFADDFLPETEIEAVATTVLALSQGTGFSDDMGSQVFAANCATCHGDNGEGLREMGGPRLSDGIWLYGGSLEEIMTQIRSPRHGMMPAWGTRLDLVTIKQLSVYVHSRGGGE